MAILDTTKKPYIADRDERISIGIDFPFRKSNDKNGWFATTSTTIEAIKNNIKNLLNTIPGERFFQPTLGLDLRKYIFENMDDELEFKIKEEIIKTFKFWLPFVEVRDLVLNQDKVRYKITIDVVFNITKNPNSLQSVQVEIGE
jgi:phage baseplate assembly protein W